MLTRELQICEQLRFMYRNDFFDALKFKYYGILYHQIHLVAAI